LFIADFAFSPSHGDIHFDLWPETYRHLCVVNRYCYPYLQMGK
jgi:hypothetical protein